MLLSPEAENAKAVLEGEVDRITFESSDGTFRVVRLIPDGQLQSITLVGSFPRVAPGARVRVHGALIHDRKHGEQFQVSSLMELSPNTLSGIERYLGSGLIKGVGETYAKRIVATFGIDSLRVLEEDPSRLHEVEGLGPKRVQSIIQAWQEQRGIRDVMVFLQSHGASPSLATRIWKKYGPRAVAIVSSDPYRLSFDVWGVGFKTSDRMAASLGIDKLSSTRFQAGILQVLRDARDLGHVYIPREEALARAACLLGFSPDDEIFDRSFGDGARALQEHGHVVSEMSDGREVWFESDLHTLETEVAEGVYRSSVRVVAIAPDAIEASLKKFQSEVGTELSEQQRQAVILSGHSSFSVITGGPGVGKTTVVRAILDMFDGQGYSVRLAAPTGRAAKRLSEATKREACTVHRLLEFDPKGQTFRRSGERPLEADVVIVDEVSMMDLAMMNAFLKAACNARVVLVGDADQLPSVGPGAVLRDLLRSEVVASVRLTEVFRQARQSWIVMNAHRINQGELPESPEPGANSADFYILERRDADTAVATIVEVVKNRIPRRFGFEPIRDIQVLTPMHKGPVGAVALNEALQRALNPGDGGVSRGSRSFRVGDKVMQLRNDYDRNVWNGDVGFVTRIDWEQELVYVGFEPIPKGSQSEGCARTFEREVAYEKANLDELVLAYACTVHKSQGSEYEAVVVVLMTSHFVMATRNLLYTAVTRGKKLVVLVGDPRAIHLAVTEDRRDERRTRLWHRLMLAFGAERSLRE